MEVFLISKKEVEYLYPKTQAKIQEQLASDVYPGVVYRFIEQEKIETHVLGDAQVLPEVEKMTAAHLFDVASLTKVVCTTTVILKLWETGRVDLNAPVATYLPEFQDKKITIKHLLTHTGDIVSYIENRNQLNKEELKAAYLTVHSGKNLGKIVKYTDAGTIILGFMLEKIYHKTAIEIFKEVVLEPLKMTHSGFLKEHSSEKIVATIIEKGQVLHGTTHDPKARILAEHAGNAGLFTTIDDLTNFAQVFLQNGKFNGQEFLKAETVANLIHDWTDKDTTGIRSLGWALRELPNGTQIIFHTGYTGTFLLLDITNGRAFLFLSNRVHLKDDRQGYIEHRDELINCYLSEILQ